MSFAGRNAIAALRSGAKASGVGSKAASPRGALLPRGRPLFALTTVVPAQLLPWRARATDARVLSAMGLGMHSGGGGVLRRLTVPSGGSSEVEAQASKSPKRLLSEIMACTDAQGLLGLVQKHGQSFKGGHVGVAWGKMTEIPEAEETGDEVEVLKQLQVLTRAIISEWQGPQIATVVHSMARLQGSGRMKLGDELGGELQARAKATVGDFPPQAVAMLMYGLATMGTSMDAGLVEAMQARAKAKAGGFTPQELAILLHSLEKMGIKNPEPGLLEAMQQRATAVAGDFSPQEITLLLSTLGKMGVTPEAGLLTALQWRATATAGYFSPVELTSFLASLERAGVKRPVAGHILPP